MSLFGDSRPQTPDDDIAVAKLLPVTDEEILTQEIEQDEAPEDDQSIADTDITLSTARKPAKKIISRFRRWYHNELNLVDAFETAASNDLAQNLLGFALERKAAIDSVEAQQSDAWTSKSRFNSESDAETLRRTHDWAAWPCPLKELPEDISGFASWRIDRGYGPSENKRKRRRVETGLRDELASVGLELAREQLASSTASHTMRRSEQNELLIASERKPARFSTDEEASVRLLRPAIQEIVQRLDHLFSVLKPIKKKGKHDYDLLDWDDVFHLAQDMQWEEQALEATIARCSGMFGGQRKVRDDKEHAKAVPTNVREGTSRRRRQQDLIHQMMQDGGKKEYEI